MSWGAWLLGVLLIIVCFLLMLVILLQRGRGGGLVGAFGGAGGTSAFGAKTGDVFTWITVVMATFFVFLAVVSNFVFDQSPAPASPAVAAPLPSEQPPGGGESLPVSVTPVEGSAGTEGTPPGPGQKKMIPVKMSPDGKLVPVQAEPGETPPEQQDAKPADGAEQQGSLPDAPDESEDPQPVEDQAESPGAKGVDPQSP